MPSSEYKPVTDMMWARWPSEEPVEIKFVSLKTRTPILNEQFWLAPGAAKPYAHERRDGCPFCWMEDEAALRVVEAGRWDDDGGAPARLTLADFPELNPRWVLWAIARGANPYDFIRPEGSDEPVYVIDYEDEQRRRLPSAMVFSFWVRARWREWAAERGFTKCDAWGNQPHEVALRSGHTYADFDAWLRRKVEG